MTGLPYPPPYQDLPTLAKHVCASESTIENWVKLGLFPAPKKIGGKRLWAWKEVERRLAKQEAAVATSNEAEAVRDATRKALERA